MTACATRACADERCRKPLPPGHRTDHCDKKCQNRHSARERSRKRSGTGVANRQPAFIRLLREEVPEGLCVYCERELTGRQRFICGDPQCHSDYQRDHKREVYALKQGQPLEETPVGPAEAELVAQLRASTARLSMQLDGFRAGVREVSTSVDRVCGSVDLVLHHVAAALDSLAQGGAR